MLTRSRPASRSGTASRSRPMPLVVRDSVGRGDSSAAAATIDTSPGRSSGSPPVNRISLMPNRWTATLNRRTTSSSVSTEGPGNQGRPSGGMQYEHRRLHRSVRDTRRSVATRPYLSTSSADGGRSVARAAPPAGSRASAPIPRPQRAARGRGYGPRVDRVGFATVALLITGLIPLYLWRRLVGDTVTNRRLRRLTAAAAAG